MSGTSVVNNNDIYFRRIGWRDTLDVINLSHSLLPRELCRSTHTLFALFFNFERNNTNLSFGLYSADKMVGYMLVYFLDRSLYHQRDERIVHIDEYCVMPEYRGRGRDVISRMVHEFGLFQQESGIEAIATGGALEHWLSIGRIVNRWGYETNVRENDCERAGHAMGRIRWEFMEGESWRPNTPMKLPKAIATLDQQPNSYKLLHVRNTRQWLSLQPAYRSLAGEHGEGWFQYAWQWWRHFGISEQLSILALEENGEIVCVCPFSNKPSKVAQTEGTVSLMAENSAYPTVPVICDGSEYKVRLAMIQQLIDLDNTLNKSQLMSALTKTFVRSGGTVDGVPDIKQVAGPRDWFGLNRRERQLHEHFLHALTNTNP